jgi:hypothetical protein
MRNDHTHDARAGLLVLRMQGGGLAVALFFAVGSFFCCTGIIEDGARARSSPAIFLP